VAPGFTARVIFSNLTAPRGVAFDSKENILVVERGLGVSVFSQSLATPVNAWNRELVIKNADLTHGIQIEGNKLYVSTAKDVLLYSWDPATRTVGSAAPYPVVTGLPADGELTTHTLYLEPGATRSNGMLIGSGPLTNIDLTARDPASGRSQIRRFVWPNITLPVYPPIPSRWENGQVIAYGIRNPAGFAYPTGPSVTPVNSRDLYVVENGASIDEVTGLTPAFVNDNPADELELVNYPTVTSSAVPKSYGFPDCTTLWNGSADPIGVPKYVGLPSGTQISLNLDKSRDDAFCAKTPALNQPPVLDFQAHSVPLDIKFYTPPTVSGPATLPNTLANSAFVSFHGSFDRKPPTGYGVVNVPFPIKKVSSTPLGYSFIVQAKDLNSCPGSCIRPVGLAFSADGKLYVSSDSSGELFVIERSQFTTG